MDSPWGYLINQTEEERIIELRSRNVVITCYREHLFEILRYNFNKNVLKTRSYTCWINGTCVNEMGSFQNGALLKVQTPTGFIEYLFLGRHPPENALLEKVILQLSNKYIVGRKIGQGGFGNVFTLFEKASGYKMALKVPHSIHRDESYVREAQVFRELDHPCIIYSECISFSPPLMIMEYLQGGDLSKFVNQMGPHLTEKQTKVIFYQIVQAVHYLHTRGICHRDLKPANVLLCNSNKQTLIKVSDLGLAKSELIHSPMDTYCGSEIYMAPEIDVPGENYDKIIDVWSMGVILHLSLSGKFPKFKQNSSSLHWPENVLSMRNNFLLCLLQGMLQKDPMKRFDILKVNEQEWFKDEDMQKIVSKLKSSDTRGNFKQQRTSRAVSGQILLKPPQALLAVDEINPAAIIGAVGGAVAVAGGLMFLFDLFKRNRNN